MKNLDVVLQKGKKQREEINENLNRKDYVVTVYENGDDFFGMNGKKISPRRYWHPCSLNEISELISYMKNPFWTHPDLKDDMSKKGIEKILFEEKKWGINTRIVIEPLSKKLEKDYLQNVEHGFFETYRQFTDRIYGTELTKESETE